MIDTSIVATPLPDGRVSYTLGEPNWSGRRIPDIRRPGETVQIADDRMIDVVILGDGFTTQSQFTTALGDLADGVLRDRCVRHVRRMSPDPSAVHPVRPAGIEQSKLVLRVSDDQRRRGAHR